MSFVCTLIFKFLLGVLGNNALQLLQKGFLALIAAVTTTEKVGHTTYTVTGSYEGKESFLKKLERIVAKNAQQKFEDEGADE